jgi:hypothetical protein
VNYTVGDLHELLGKMKLAADLLKEVRESVGARVLRGDSAEQLDEESHAKLVRALGLHEEVNQFLTSVRQPELTPAPQPLTVHAGGDAVDDRSLPARGDESTLRSSSDASTRPGSFRIEKRRFHIVEDQPVLDHDLIEARAEGKWFTGRVLDVAEGKVIQDAGRGIASIHEASRLDSVPSTGDAVSIVYHKGRGNVIPLIASRERDIARVADSSRQHDSAG